MKRKHLTGVQRNEWATFVSQQKRHSSGYGQNYEQDLDEEEMLGRFVRSYKRAMVRRM